MKNTQNVQIHGQLPIDKELFKEDKTINPPNKNILSNLRIFFKTLKNILKYKYRKEIVKGIPIW